MRWAQAMEESLYGPRGFFTRADLGGPTAHFRTSAIASSLFPTAITRLLTQVDEVLGHPDHFDVVDMGAGRGELLCGILAALPQDLARRVRPIAVDLAARPETIPEAISWRPTPPERITGVFLATEWLDNVPLDIAELAPDGPRYVLVDRWGCERLGPVLSAEDAAWVNHWWPLEEIGSRAEIGRTRDLAWADALSRITEGLALSVDYGHTREERPEMGTLTGYRAGRNVSPVPDGTCDLTAHVAMDAVALAGQDVASIRPTVATQRRCLRQLGVSGQRPPLAMAYEDPTAYVRLLGQSSEAAELTDPSGLGGHLWLVQPVGIAWPAEIGVCETGTHRDGLEGMLNRP